MYNHMRDGDGVRDPVVGGVGADADGLCPVRRRVGINGVDFVGVVAGEADARGSTVFSAHDGAHSLPAWCDGVRADGDAVLTGADDGEARAGMSSSVCSGADARAGLSGADSASREAAVSGTEVSELFSVAAAADCRSALSGAAFAVSEADAGGTAAGEVGVVASLRADACVASAEAGADFSFSADGGVGGGSHGRSALRP